MTYTGTIYRGVDYSPTWRSFTAVGNTQTGDSDFANDAFASLWANAYQASPNGDPSAPVNNGTGSSNYRGDLNTIVSNGFNLVRLYNWDMARGTTATSDTGLDHLNFLNYANTLGLKIVVPVSDYFVSGFTNDGQFAWSGTTPDSSYSFASAPASIQQDFEQFIASITDPATGKIHTAIHSISVGNEGDIGQGIAGTTASNFLARTNWWIYNLHQQINGTGAIGPDGLTVVNGSSGAIIPISATFSNADQGGTTGTWFNDLLGGVSATTPTPNGWPGGGTFGTAVTGLSAIDSGYASYYYNSVNISQVSAASPYSAAQLSQSLGFYDAGGGISTQDPSGWPYPTSTKYNVPLLLMEVFTNNRTSYSPTTDQATAAVNQATTIEAYLKANASTTNLMGYNYFEFNDEQQTTGSPKLTGLYQELVDASATAQTGTTSTFYGGFGNFFFPVDTLTVTPGPTGSSDTLIAAWTGAFAATYTGTAGNDTLAGTAAAETFRGAAGNDSFDGALGYDISLYAQNARGYALRATAGSATITVQDKLGTDGTDTLTATEGVRFANGALPTEWLITTASLPATQILKVVDLFTAGLNRAPDALGLDYWASQLANGASIKDISKAIFSSAEAAPIYSANNSNTVFVDLAYQTALGRAPDAAGSAYWLNELQTGHIQRTDFVTALIAGAGGSADAQYIANKEAVGAHFALTQGLNNLTWARAVEAAVNGTAASVTAANAQTDAFATIAATPATSELVVQIVGLVP